MEGHVDCSCPRLELQLQRQQSHTVHLYFPYRKHLTCPSSIKSRNSNVPALTHLESCPSVLSSSVTMVSKSSGSKSSSKGRRPSGRSMNDRGRYLPAHKKGGRYSHRNFVTPLHKMPMVNTKKPSTGKINAGAVAARQQKAALAATTASQAPLRHSSRLTGDGNRRRVKSSNKELFSATSVEHLGKRPKAATPSLVDNVRNVLASIVGRFTSSFA